MRKVRHATLLAACALLAGCYTAASMRETMAKRCEGPDVEPFVVMVEGPKEHVGGERWRQTDPRMQIKREPTFYRWLWIAMETYSPVCLVSAYRLADAARPGDPLILPAATTGKDELDVDHLAYNSSEREATYALAARAGAKYLLVARWAGGTRARYNRKDLVVSGGGWESRATDVVGVSANVQIHLHNVIERRMIYRKTYSAYEELGPPYTLSDDDDGLMRAAPLREGIVRGLQEDFLRYRDSPLNVIGRGTMAQRFDPPLEFPLHVLDTKRPSDPSKVNVELLRVNRRDQFTRVELRLKNDGRADAEARLWSNANGVMAFAKTPMGQVYRAVEDTKLKQPVRLRAGESKEMSVTLRNETGALGQVTFYFDFDLRAGSNQGVRRATFAKVVAK